MRIDCQAKPLLAALKLVQPAAAGMTTKPVLACVRIEARPDRLLLSATDTEIGITTELADVTSPAPGVVLVAADKLAGILGELGAAEVSLHWHNDGDGLTVRSGGSKWELPTWPADEFPGVAGFPDGVAYRTVDAAALANALGRTLFAADKFGAARYATQGVLFEPKLTGLTLVATDTKRLAAVDVQAEEHGDGDEAGKGPHVVPTKALTLLARTLPDEGAVAVLLRPNEAYFRAGPATVHTRLVEGRYPPYRDIIPKRHGVAIPLPVAGFLSAVRQASIMADDESKRVDVAFEPAGGLTLKARGATTGESEVTAAHGGYEGEPQRIAFDPVYLSEFLRAVGAESVTLQMTGPNKPALFVADDGYRYLVMPLV